MAGVITDARGRVLLTRRTEGRDLAGLWEFPGGKREPGETREQALARELDEELGIRVEIGAPLITVPQRYPHKRLRLDVRMIDGWRGAPKGHEGQAMAWVPQDKLERYMMPPADRPVVAALRQPDRYAVTPSPGPDERDEDWLAGVERLLANGIRRLQLRLPDIEVDRRKRLVAAAALLGRAVHADVLVNGDAVLAAEHGCGLHLPARQLMACEARPVAEDIPFGASCHDVDQLRQAERVGCDFVVLGPVAATASHPGVPGLGWDAFAAMREEVSLPIYAIGGLATDGLALARAHGAQGIAAIRGFWAAEPAPAPGRRRGRSRVA
ncbi:Nudix family hydrolase [Luteimonas yindakuii]|uniref:8-oxo-dGTP diphosphatase n=2 Tax=Luteimonas yindakuii TaxID=2565782 RepID=A0A4Z1R6U1_9GAMM|nr:Nudix family hydrolase [Luteimonas yindakuii]TKS55362.1 Nudix family hydrolase [Luteimonas yindakuii]